MGDKDRQIASQYLDIFVLIMVISRFHSIWKNLNVDLYEGGGNSILAICGFMGNNIHETLFSVQLVVVWVRIVQRVFLSLGAACLVLQIHATIRRPWVGNLQIWSVSEGLVESASSAPICYIWL